MRVLSCPARLIGSATPGGRAEAAARPAAAGAGRGAVQAAIPVRAGGAIQALAAAGETAATACSCGSLPCLNPRRFCPSRRSTMRRWPPLWQPPDAARSTPPRGCSWHRRMSPLTNPGTCFPSFPLHHAHAHACTLYPPGKTRQGCWPCWPDADGRLLLARSAWLGGWVATTGRRWRR
jgi:hypothetical protein